MNMRQRLGLALLIFWLALPLSAEPINQIAWVVAFFVGVIIFTFPSKDEPK